MTHSCDFSCNHDPIPDEAKTRPVEDEVATLLAHLDLNEVPTVVDQNGVPLVLSLLGRVNWLTSSLATKVRDTPVAQSIEEDAAAFEAHIGGKPSRVKSDAYPWGWRYTLDAYQQEFKAWCKRPAAVEPEPLPVKSHPELTVWYGSMPESNGKSNFTAILHRKDKEGLATFEGFTIARSEYPDRVRYDADSMRYLIGELAEEPCILDYDGDKHSGYVSPKSVDAKSEKLAVAYDVLALIIATTTDPETAKLAADNIRQFMPNCGSSARSAGVDG